MDQSTRQVEPNELEDCALGQSTPRAGSHTPRKCGAASRREQRPRTAREPEEGHTHQVERFGASCRPPSCAPLRRGNPTATRRPTRCAANGRAADRTCEPRSADWKCRDSFVGEADPKLNGPTSKAAWWRLDVPLAAQRPERRTTMRTGRARRRSCLSRNSHWVRTPPRSIGLASQSVGARRAPNGTRCAAVLRRVHRRFKR